MAKPAVATVVGVAWYSPDTWALMREIAPDRADLHDTYKGWLAEAQRAELAVIAGGHVSRRVQVDPAELAAWCLIRAKAPDLAARAEFVSNKLRQEAARK